MSDEPVVTRHGLLDCQVCIPAGWSDRDIIAFAEQQFPCGTMNGWAIRREGDPALAGAHERVQCSARPGFIHVTLDA